jgi:hypothetical protein
VFVEKCDPVEQKQISHEEENRKKEWNIESPVEIKLTGNRIVAIEDHVIVGKIEICNQQKPD